MPEFAPGESKTAIAPIAVRPSGLSCEAELFLGPDEMTKVATSGRIPLVSTGVSQDIRLPVVMPTAEGTYHVYLDLYAEGILVAAYQAIEDVAIEVAFQYLSDLWVGETIEGQETPWEVTVQNIGGDAVFDIIIDQRLEDPYNPGEWSSWGGAVSISEAMVAGETRVFSGTLARSWRYTYQTRARSQAGTLLNPPYPPE